MATWRTVGLVCTLLLAFGGKARRIQVTDAVYPYLGTEAGGAVRWSGGAMLEALYYADWIEIAPRGIRIGRGSPTTSTTTAQQPPRGTCRATSDALCVLPEGLVLPSPPVGDVAGTETRTVVRGGVRTPRVPFPVMDRVSMRRMMMPVTPNQSSSSSTTTEEEEEGLPLMLAYAEQEACRTHGKGRRLLEWNRTAAGGQHHTVTACDVVEGHWVALYAPASDSVRLATQTFGSTAYVAVLVQAVVCLYCATATAVAKPSALASAAASAAASPPRLEEARRLLARRSAAAAACLLLSCIGRDALHPIPFVTDADRLHFGLTCGTGAWLVACAAVTGRMGQGGEACVYALMALADAMYRSPENSYAGIVCAVLVVRQWQKALDWGASSSAVPQPPLPQRLGDALDLWLCTLVLCVTAELGVATQCLYAERWPFYAGAAVYIGFVIAYLRS
jgi:hypothetical protein